MNQTHPTSEQIVEYLHRELPADQDAAVHAHLAACAQCAQVYEAEASLTEMLRAHARARERELPGGVVSAIHRAIERPLAASLWERLGNALRPAIAVPVTAAIAAALYLGMNAWHGASGATSIGAAYYVNNHAALTAGSPFSEDPPVPTALTSEADAAR